PRKERPSMTTLDALLAELKAYRSGPGVFNPYADVDPVNDMGPEAPSIRLRQLALYLQPRIPGASYLLVGEAMGFQGGRFSGIAMTSERILLGQHATVQADWVLPSGAPQRTSRPAIKPNGFNEPTATIAWGALHDTGLRPTAFIIWNSFPFHPYHPDRGPLTNRTPTPEELTTGARFLRQLLALCPAVKVIAVGLKAAATLDDLGVPCTPVRHPANGGANQFREGIRAIVR
ncbi:MAG: uracil-DNA glycosylase, partial [Mycobacterium leprae]